eukprot:Em0010g959a
MDRQSAHLMTRVQRLLTCAVTDYYTSNSQPQSLKPFSEIPGPKGLPIVGSLFDLIRGSTKAGDDYFLHQLALKYGPIAKVTTLNRTSPFNGISVSFSDIDDIPDGISVRFSDIDDIPDGISVRFSDTDDIPDSISVRFSDIDCSEIRLIPENGEMMADEKNPQLPIGPLIDLRSHTRDGIDYVIFNTKPGTPRPKGLPIMKFCSSANVFSHKFARATKSNEFCEVWQTEVAPILNVPVAEACHASSSSSKAKQSRKGQHQVWKRIPIPKELQKIEVKKKAI